MEIVHRSPCKVDQNWFKIIATVGKRLGETLPVFFLSQLNSKISKGPESVSYTFQRHNFLIGYDGSVAITFIKDDEELEVLKSKTIQTINSAIVYSLAHHETLDDLLRRRTSARWFYMNVSSRWRDGTAASVARRAASPSPRGSSMERDAQGCPHVDTSMIEMKRRPIILF